MKDFCIVGSGIAGSTIANLLSKKYTVEIFDKARGPGGRAASRKYIKDLSFDHGLQYIAPKSKEFKKLIVKLKNKNILKEWNKFHLNSNSKKNNSTKYIGLKGNNDIVKYFIRGIKANYLSQVTSIKFHSNFWTIILNNKKKVFFKNLILTCPFPQLKILGSKYLEDKIKKLKIKMIPNITIMLVYKDVQNLTVSSIKFNDDIISWACNENSKEKFKSNHDLWTIQLTNTYSKKIINKYKNNKIKYQKIVIKKFEKLLGLSSSQVIFSNIHGWKYAYTNKLNVGFKSSWNNKYRLGVCGDWLVGSKAESAWLSAHNLFKKTKKNPLKT